MNRKLEAAHLAAADRHIAEGQARIALQRTLIAHLKRRDFGTEDAEDLLRLLTDTLVQYQHHRDMIAASIATSDGRER